MASKRHWITLVLRAANAGGKRGPAAGNGECNSYRSRQDLSAHTGEREKAAPDLAEQDCINTVFIKMEKNGCFKYQA